eukprot:TRINITY_DN50620_c0_g1_i1.p1 TRINITY_DN50620_c0_g1~~TRINITY_DN50620_c0_g1_i1.p1  ORF type:complete len:125 (-),score=5.41 TRINITY_DN50620_c0_g1_i1:63-437(-)
MSSIGSSFFFFQAEDGIRDLVRSRGLGDVYKRQGIHCHNLTCWNSLSVRIGEGPYVLEYLHIMPNSASVKVGDRVRAGQTLCLSGQVGFAPEPHVHLELHHEDELKGPSSVSYTHLTLPTKRIV